MNRKSIGSTSEHAKHPHRGIVAPNPRSVPIVEPDTDIEPDQPFQEGAHDEIDSDLRHRLISEAAYALYAGRGYVDGFDVDDWLAAEAEVDHVVLSRAGDLARHPIES